MYNKLKLKYVFFFTTEQLIKQSRHNCNFFLLTIPPRGWKSMKIWDFYCCIINECSLDENVTFDPNVLFWRGDYEYSIHIVFYSRYLCNNEWGCSTFGHMTKSVKMHHFEGWLRVKQHIIFIKNCFSEQNLSYIVFICINKHVKLKKWG